MSYQDNLADSLYTGFIDSNAVSLEEYNPALLVNDSNNGKKFLTSLIHQLRNCDEFLFSVAFITNSGVACLINILKELENRGVRGKIIASQYQNFTEPRALRRLITLQNVEVRIVVGENFHAKGYIFRKNDQYCLIVGSSNLTQNALSLNKEWNLKVCSTNEGELIKNTLQEFYRTFDSATPVTEQWLEAYLHIYEDINSLTEINRTHMHEIENKVFAINRISPNKMQVEALAALKNLRSAGKNKALIISATGTGKTYLSAFDLKQFKPRKFLFIVHRENIAKAAMKSYYLIFGKRFSMGLLTGHDKQFQSDFIFSTIQTLSKDEILKQFAPDYFDYIVIDEVHRSGASSYQKIIQYFKPKFLLGMTATPERTDGFDIFKAFDYNIAYEIRLNRALEEKMLSPFHYYGVREISVDGVPLDEFSSFNRLVCDERVDRIIEAANFYGCDHGRVKGLVFCSRIDEAEELSNKFNQRGYKTVALNGSNSEIDREDAINRLESDDGNCLDYIFTVDIFNEGVDIPSVNQIIMLRPTQSAIVFVQQLGRGLRKTSQKEYLVVIDFIGNYANNYLVPIALYGDNSYNKDNLRKLMAGGSSYIPGASTVDFDEITKAEIFATIDCAKMSLLADMKNDYRLLKYQLGHVPSMMDFVKYGGRDPFLFVEYSNSYYNFVVKVDEDFTESMPLKSIKLLEFISKELCNGKRVEELLILKAVINNGRFGFQVLSSLIKKQFGYDLCDEIYQSALKSINGQFLKPQDRAKYKINKLVDVEYDDCKCSDEFKDALKSTTFRTFLLDALNYGLFYFSTHYTYQKFFGGLILYGKYSRKDVCRILNWDKDESSTVYGYRIKNNTCPIFVTYNKNEEISESTKYADVFINNHQFSWMTRNRVTLYSSEVLELKAYKETKLRILLFVKKSDGEGSDFYYLGDVEPYEFNQETIRNSKDQELPIVNIKFNLLQPVEEMMYEYLTM